jgi:hypothetical protein
MASQACFFCGKKRPIGAFRPLWATFGSPISGPIPIFQTVSEGEFSEVKVQEVCL